MQKSKKGETITFKADAALAKALQQVANKSEFIRKAIIASLENQCPLCRGTGIMTNEQREHWENFKAHHTLETCNTCQATHIVCEAHTRDAHH